MLDRHGHGFLEEVEASGHKKGGGATKLWLTQLSPAKAWDHVGLGECAKGTHEAGFKPLDFFRIGCLGRRFRLLRGWTFGPQLIQQRRPTRGRLSKAQRRDVSLPVQDEQKSLSGIWGGKSTGNVISELQHQQLEGKSVRGSRHGLIGYGWFFRFGGEIMLNTAYCYRSLDYDVALQ